MDEVSIIRRLMDTDIHITPGALDTLRKQTDSQSAVERVLTYLREMVDKPPVLTEGLVTKILEVDIETRHQPPSSSYLAIERQETAVVEGPTRTVPELVHLKFKPQAADVEPRIELLKDITGHSYSEGELKDFVKLFKDRYDRLSNMLRKRVDLHEAVPISSLTAYDDGDAVRVIGIVADKRETRSGHIVLELEDLSGRATAWIFKGRRELMRKAAEVVTDEVIGIEAMLRKGDAAPRLIAIDIIWPDVPTPREPSCAADPVCAALLSDLHVGSEMFLEDAFMKFLKWLRGEVGNPEQRELAGRVKYVVIAGDLVDGVGVYPQQEEELLIHDIFRQYEAATELLAQIPDHITLIIAPGNHDAVRPSEPQPALPRDVTSALYDLNSLMVGNPAWLLIHGVRFLVYHGRSFDDLVAMVPGLNREKPTSSMIKMLQKRHLAPIYGGRTAIAPEDKDYLVIEDVPDVFHCGHMHVYGYEKYRDITVVNSGTFQEMTSYMKRLGVKPTPGIVPIIDLQTGQTRAIYFA
ncbi:MAG: DNA-directed DNA polymerase II small subunit [Candidatus Hodarchaeaceae archaeon]|nr:DNA-directed DNA polymerase II small subunit [Candidatus Hodarchaeaceae archaeon]